MRRRLFTGDHPHIAQSLNNLAQVYHAEGRLDDAAALKVEALEMFRKLYGRQHPLVAAALDNLAATYDALGRVTAAEKCVQGVCYSTSTAYNVAGSPFRVVCRLRLLSVSHTSLETCA